MACGHCEKNMAMLHVETVMMSTLPSLHYEVNYIYSALSAFESKLFYFTMSTKSIIKGSLFQQCIATQVNRFFYLNLNLN